MQAYYVRYRIYTHLLEKREGGGGVCVRFCYAVRLNNVENHQQILLLLISQSDIRVVYRQDIIHKFVRIHSASKWLNVRID